MVLSRKHLSSVYQKQENWSAFIDVVKQGSCIYIRSKKAGNIVSMLSRRNHLFISEARELSRCCILIVSPASRKHLFTVYLKQENCLSYIDGLKEKSFLLYIRRKRIGNFLSMVLSRNQLSISESRELVIS